MHDAFVSFHRTSVGLGEITGIHDSLLESGASREMFVLRYSNYIMIQNLVCLLLTVCLILGHPISKFDRDAVGEFENAVSVWRV